MEENKEQISVQSDPNQQQMLIKQNSQVVNKPVPSAKTLTGMRMLRLGKIFSNISIACSLVGLLAMLIAFIAPMMHGIIVALVMVACLLAIILLSIFTLGIIYLKENNPVVKIFNFMSNMGNIDNSAAFANFCYSLVPYLSIGALVTAVLSLPLLFINKQEKCVGRIIFACIMAVISIVLLVVYYLIGGVLWQNLN